MPADPRCREARPDDAEVLVSLVRELAVYERAADQVRVSPGQLRAALFGENPLAEAVVAEVGGEVVGMAIFFTTFSTWTGNGGIHLEDLYVRPRHRRNGVGRALLQTVAGICSRRGHSRLEWSVLDWNEPARAFYRTLGAELLNEWQSWRVDGSRLQRLASG